MLSIRDLRQVYNLGSAEEREAIANISFSVQPGEFVCIVGPSGAGKTTLLRCLSGLLKPTGGEVRFEGHRLDKVPDRLSVVFQDYSRSLFPWLTVAGNIAVPLKVAGMARRSARPESRRCSTPSASARSASSTRGSCPAGCSSGSRSPAPWRTSPSCC